MTGADLVRRMAEGDRDAFKQFYDRHARQVYPLILRIVRDPSDAADVLQEVFWEAWQSAASYDPGRGSPRRGSSRGAGRGQSTGRAIRRRGDVRCAGRRGVAAAAADPAGRGGSHGDRDLVVGALAGCPKRSAGAGRSHTTETTQTEIAERLKHRSAR